MIAISGRNPTFSGLAKSRANKAGDLIQPGSQSASAEIVRGKSRPLRVLTSRISIFNGMVWTLIGQRYPGFDQVNRPDPEAISSKTIARFRLSPRSGVAHNPEKLRIAKPIDRPGHRNPPGYDAASSTTARAKWSRGRCYRRLGRSDWTLATTTGASRDANDSAFSLLATIPVHCSILSMA